MLELVNVSWTVPYVGAACGGMADENSDNDPNSSKVVPGAPSWHTTPNILIPHFAFEGENGRQIQ